MSSEKRSFDRAAGGLDSGNADLNRLRNMWQFANLCQWIYIFGKAIKLDDSIDIEKIETESLSPSSTLLFDIALALLRVISNHRGLTHENVNSQAQKQYQARAPHCNPFGLEETPARFQDFDVFTKITVLQQLTQWSTIYPERLREKMEEQRDIEQTNWRIEPYGWDADDRTYYVLDDNRVYRLTEAPPSSCSRPKKKKKSNNHRSGRRSSRRQHVHTQSQEPDTGADDHGGDDTEGGAQDGLGGMKWECLAISLDEVRSLLEDFRKSRDENEKVLRKQLADHLVPILERQEEGRKRKALQRERDLANLAKIANAKRSSRIASKIEQQRTEEKLREEVEYNQKAEEAKLREEQAEIRREEERDSRIASRDKRLKEREARRLLHDELAQSSAEDSNRAEDDSGRASERRLQAQIENMEALKDLEEDEDWVFDCICGLFGQVDDGTHSVACETCNIWQHSKCLGISEAEADHPEFHFICSSCRRRKESENRPKPTIRLKVGRPAASNSQHLTTQKATVEGAQSSEEIKSAEVAAAQQTRSPTQQPTESIPPIAMLGTSSSQQIPAIVGLHASDGMVKQDERDSNATRTQSASTKSPGWPSPSKHEQAKSGLPALVSSTHLPSTESLLRSNMTPKTSFEVPSFDHGLHGAQSEVGGVLTNAGVSPVKHSSPSSIAPTSHKGASVNNMVLHPEVALFPYAPQPILTPPTKQPEPVRAPGRHE